MIAGSSLFFPMIHIKYVGFMSLWPRTIKILISNWSRTRKFSQFLKNTGGGRPFLTMVTLYVNFYALIGQNLTDGFMRKIYVASSKLFTLRVFTWHRGDFRPERVHSGSLSWVYICLHDTTTKCHAGKSHLGVSSPRYLYRGENFTPARNLPTVSCKRETTTRLGVKRVCR